ncbi:PD40 domain-containing protein [candidate division KSB1 bacterium]|nr:PD40 domain-containing protein [candidate division KSB1 bacterium]
MYSTTVDGSLLINELCTIDDRLYSKYAISQDGKKMVYRSATIGYLWSVELGHNNKKTILTPEHIGARNPALSPDGKYIAYDNSLDSQVYIVSATGGELKQITSTIFSTKYQHPEWSPSGNDLVFVAKIDGFYQVCTTPIFSSDIHQLTFDNRDCEYPCWSPNGDMIAYAYTDSINNSHIAIISMTTGEKIDGNNWGFLMALYPQWHPSGEKIAFYADSEIWLFTIKNGILEKLFDAPRRKIPFWSADGEYIISTDQIYYKSISTYDFQTKESQQLTTWDGVNDDIEPVWVTEDLVAFNRNNQIWMVSYPDSDLESFTNDTTVFVNHLEISPDGKYFVFDDGYNIFMQSIQDKNIRNLSAQIHIPLTEPTISHDMKYIACRMINGLTIFPIEKNATIEHIIPGNFTNPNWSVDDLQFGSHIVVESSNNIYIISPEEHETELLITNGEHPRWSPVDRTKLMYESWGYILITDVFKKLN